MRKKELLKRIEELENRVAELELVRGHSYYFYYPQYLDWQGDRDWTGRPYPDVYPTWTVCGTSTTAIEGQ